MSENDFECLASTGVNTPATMSPAKNTYVRYCARMIGSAMDGEDVVQEALFEAYRKLDKFDHSRPLKPWLLRIAHNRCIDFLRRRGVHDQRASSRGDQPQSGQRMRGPEGSRLFS